MRDLPPTVSVVVPLYNEVSAVERCLDAILSQDYPPDRVEVAIADAGSNDGTVSICEAVITAHPDRFIWHLSHTGRTPAAGLNLLVGRTAGEIVVRVDGHVEIAPDYVSRCVAALSATNADVVGGC